MNPITVKEIVSASKGRLLYGDGNAVVREVSTDSRKVAADTLFIPIIGEVHDAHKFIPQVVDSGCRTIMASEPESVQSLTDCNIILVDDTITAMQDLSKYYLDSIGVRRIAVTGSVGKTSTRDMVYYICSEKYKTGRPVANFNNNVGVPLTIFSFDDTMEVAVFELGLDHAGDIHRYAEITRPEAGIITNVGISHMENLGSRENIRKAKMEVVDFFGPDDMLVINETCDLLNKEDITGDYRVVSVGDGDEDYVVSDINDQGEKGIEFTLKTGETERRISLGVPGAHNAINAALAIAACTKLGITMDEAIRGLKNLQLTGKRLAVREARGIRVIDDTYNAAPDSMKSAINTLMSADGTRKIAILGGMNELGEDSRAYHEEIGRYAAEKGVDLFIGVAEKAADMVKGAEEGGCSTLWFETREELYPELPKLLRTGDVVLIKASNALHMDKVADEIIKG